MRRLEPAWHATLWPLCCVLGALHPPWKCVGASSAITRLTSVLGVVWLPPCSEILSFGILKANPRKLRTASRLHLEYMDRIEHEDGIGARFDPTHVAEVYLHTYVDKDGFVPREVSWCHVQCCPSGVGPAAQCLTHTCAHLVHHTPGL